MHAMQTKPSRSEMADGSEASICVRRHSVGQGEGGAQWRVKWGEGGGVNGKKTPIATIFHSKFD